MCLDEASTSKSDVTKKEDARSDKCAFNEGECMQEAFQNIKDCVLKKFILSQVNEFLRKISFIDYVLCNNNMGKLINNYETD